MKYKVWHALLLSVLMMKAPLAMEEEEAPKTAAISKKTFGPASPFSRLPDDIVRFIFGLFQDPRDFFSLLGTCRKAYEIGREPRFYLPETPTGLLKQLEGIIDHPREKFHFKKIIPLVVRTRNAGDLFFKAGMSYYPTYKEYYELETLLNCPFRGSERPTDEQLRKWQPYGLALLLAQHTGSQRAKQCRDWTIDTSLSLHLCDDKVFFHLLPQANTPLIFKAKLQYQCFNFVKTLKATQENTYISYGYSRNRAHSASFVTVLEDISTSLRNLSSLTDPRSQKLTAFFQQKECRLFEKQTFVLKGFLENKRQKMASLKPGTLRDQLALEEGALENKLKEVIDLTTHIHMHWADLSDDPTQKVMHCLKNASFCREMGTGTEASWYHRAAEYVEGNNILKTQYYVKAASLHEGRGEFLSAADEYNSALRYFDHKDLKIACALTEALLCEKAGDSLRAADAYGRAAAFMKNGAQKAEYYTKCAFCYQKAGDAKQAAIAFYDAAVHTPDRAQKIAYLQEAALICENLGEKRVLPQVYRKMAEFSENKADIVAYSLKAARLHEAFGEGIEAAQNYSRVALEIPDSWHGRDVAEKAFLYYQNGGVYPKETFFWALFLSFYAEEPAKKEQWLRQVCEYAGSVNTSQLEKRLAALKKIPQEEVTQELEKIANEHWPEI